MSNIERNGDSNTAGGVAVGGADSVFVNGQNVMLPNTPVIPHPCYPKKGCNKHRAAITTGGSSTVFVEGQPVSHSNDVDSCGHKRSNPSPNVFVGK